MQACDRVTPIEAVFVGRISGVEPRFEAALTASGGTPRATVSGVGVGIDERRRETPLAVVVVIAQIWCGGGGVHTTHMTLDHIHHITSHHITSNHIKSLERERSVPSGGSIARPTLTHRSSAHASTACTATARPILVCVCV